MFVSSAASILLFSFLDNYHYVNSDGIGYYSYLPAIFIDDDLTFNRTVEKYADYYNEEPTTYGVCKHDNALCDEYIGLKPQANGTWLDKYPVGVAIFLAPFFFIADIYVRLTDGMRDGISPEYQIAVGIAGIIWLQFAIFATYKVLRHRFDKNISLSVLVFLLGGTNLIHFAINQPSMSHIYSFTFVTLCIYFLDRYLEKPNLKYLFLIGLSLSVIGLLRNINILVGIIPFITILLKTPKQERIRIFGKMILIWGLTFLSVMIPQMAYWKIATGKFLIYGYPNENFYWLEPHLKDILFNQRANGLFFWHPLLLLVIPGIYFWLKSKDKINRVSVFFLVLITYILSCWWAYWFGYSFGHRAFTDHYIFFLIPIGYLFQYISKLDRKYIITFAAIVALFILLNLNQINLYWRGIVASHNNTWENYKENFANPRVNFKEILD